MTTILTIAFLIIGQPGAWSIHGAIHPPVVKTALERFLEQERK